MPEARHGATFELKGLFEHRPRPHPETSLAVERAARVGERLGVEVVNVDVVVTDEIAGTVSTLTATVERPEE